MNRSVIGGAPEPGEVPIDLVDRTGLDQWLSEQPESTGRWVRSSGFEARPGTRCLVPDSRHELASLLVGVSDRTDPWCCAGLPAALPDRRFRIRTDLDRADLERIAIGWGLGAYRFDRYRTHAEDEARTRATLCVDESSAVRVNRQVDATFLVRDLINTPASDLLPGDLFDEARSLAARFGGECTCITGEELVANGYPAIHAVGRASAEPPGSSIFAGGTPLHPG